MIIVLFMVLALFVVYLLAGIRIVRPTHRGVVETLGKYSRFLSPGFNWILPIFQRTHLVEVTEDMTDIEPQEIITEDNLNAVVDLIVYYQVKGDEENVKKSLYAVGDFHSQIISLAQTTARNVIGGMAFKDVNSQRGKLNAELRGILSAETEKWGVEVLKVELKEIVPPRDVQDTMNQVIKAENSKRAAIDFATAQETQADGLRRSAIKEAEGQKQAEILKAEGKAEAFKLIDKAFVGNAKLLRELEVTENALKNNSKIILTDKGITPQLIIGNLPVEQ